MIDPHTYCPDCGGPRTRSIHTANQPADSKQCAPCWYNENGPVKLLNLDELDDLIDHVPAPYEDLLLRALHNTLVDWHSEIAPLILTEHGLRIRVTLRCTICDGFPMQVLAGSGLHNGAWPYIYDDEGDMMGNIRDNEYQCETCQKERAARRASYEV